MNKERWLPRAAGAFAIVALVLVTNEGYRHVRALFDDVAQAKREVASLKREVYVLQVQLDTRPTGSPVLAVPNAPTEAVVAQMPAAPAAPVSHPMPAPIGSILPLPDAAARPRSKPQSSVVANAAANDEQKSLVSVVLMSDAKPAAAALPPSVKPHEEPKMDVKLVGDTK